MNYTYRKDIEKAFSKWISQYGLFHQFQMIDNWETAFMVSAGRGVRIPHPNQQTINDQEIDITESISGEELNKKDVKFNIRLTTDDKDKLVFLTRYYNITMAELIRSMINLQYDRVNRAINKKGE